MDMYLNTKQEEIVGVCIVYCEESSPVDLKTYVWQDMDCPLQLLRFKEFATAFESQKDKKIISLQKIKI